MRFQSTHPRGVRPFCFLQSAILKRFQSTHPRGVRLFLVSPVTSSKSFNPRTHEGCDIPRASKSADGKVFQSTHPRGVRHQVALPWRAEHVSIHAPTRGATDGAAFVVMRVYCFNPRTHEGCDIVLTIRTLRLFCFNPRTHEGCDSETP